MKSKFAFIGLMAIFAIGLFIRLLGLDHFPTGLNWDETSIGYNAWSLLTGGRDEWGTTFPAIFPAFGDYKLPLTIYLTVPFTWLFGQTILAVRGVSGLMGSLLIPITFIFIYRLFKNRHLALLSAFIIAFQPWTWFFSRAALEANIALTLLTLAAALFVSGRSGMALLFASLSAWTYNSARGFIPLYLLFIAWQYRHHLPDLVRAKRPNLAVAISVFLLLGVIWQLLSSAGQTRFAFMSLIDSGAVARIEEMRLASDLPHFLVRALYNRPVYFVVNATANWFRYFSWDFLFFSGGSHYQFNVQGFGLFSQLFMPLFYIGLFTLFLKKTFPYRKLLLGWLVLSLLPASIVRDAPHPLRAITFIPLAVTLIVAGWDQTARVLRLSSRMFLLPIILSMPFIAVYVFSLSQYAVKYSWAWQAGYPQLVDYIRTNYSHYDRILITKRYAEPHIFLLYFWPWPPDSFRNDPNLVRYSRSDWFWVDAFDKFRFINAWEMEQVVDKMNPDDNVLIIAGPENRISATRLTQIDFLSGEPAFIIFSK